MFLHYRWSDDRERDERREPDVVICQLLRWLYAVVVAFCCSVM